MTHRNFQGEELFFFRYHHALFMFIFLTVKFLVLYIICNSPNLNNTVTILKKV